MKELKCPKCGNVFTVDENDYAALLSQVKNTEFEAELNRRIHELEQTLQERQKAEQARIASEQQAEQLRRTQAAMTAIQAKENIIQQKENEIVSLKAQLQSIESVKQAELAAELAKKDTQLQERTAAQSQEIERLRNAEALAKSQALIRENGIRDEYEMKLKLANEQVAYYKDLKIKLSTKMVGESLEQHCYNEFTRISPLFPNAEFHKDNDLVIGEDGKSTKGDFVFRDKSDEGIEYISIMFEMKNENEDTTQKHKNQEFFAKLDQDRKKKNCEFAVLVSMLEPENDLYNEGIVAVTQNDKGEKFDKMYVIRPQFFVPLITLLCQTSRKSLETRRELEIIKAQNIDVTNFEEKLTTFKDGFTRNVRLANERFANAIDEIDKTIAHLTKVRENLVKSSDNLNAADKKLQDVTIKRLTHGNPTMKAKFEEARQNNPALQTPDEEETT